jgi:hypothetical protein
MTRNDTDMLATVFDINGTQLTTGGAGATAWGYALEGEPR